MTRETGLGMAMSDMLVINAVIRTMAQVRPTAEAMLIRAGRVHAVGSEGEMRRLAVQGASVLDAGGRMILPGFHDTHIHHIEGGHHYVEGADLSACGGPDAIVEELRSFAAKSDRPWIYGAFYEQSRLHIGNLDRHLLDRAVPDRPCMVVSADGHNGCINSFAINLLDIGDDTPDPPEGHFVRDAGGHATGLLYETAVDWVNKRRPEATEGELEEGVRFAQSLENGFGITSVLDAKINEKFAKVYNRMAACGELTSRVVATALVRPGEGAEAAVKRLDAMRVEATNPMFRVHSAKFFFDGVIENRTAAMIAPYADAEGGNAPLMFDPADIERLFIAFDAARFQIHVHAIGDLAVRASLDGMEAARKANGVWPSRHHIAHIQFIDPADIPRFAALGVVANVQPLWAHHGTSVDELAAEVVGPERSAYMYAFRSLRDAGAEMVLSSDWTVSTCNPFEIIETAITRQAAGEHSTLPPFLPEQALTIEECVYGYTIGAARSAWRDHETGSLEPGKLADFIVIDQDIFACKPEAIGQTKVLATYLGGALVYGGL
jgi:predicted amidohydrolase YtcJ